jgi:hypothetical protein
MIVAVVGPVGSGKGVIQTLVCEVVNKAVLKCDSEGNRKWVLRLAQRWIAYAAACKSGSGFVCKFHPELDLTITIPQLQRAGYITPEEARLLKDLRAKFPAPPPDVCIRVRCNVPDAFHRVFHRKDDADVSMADVARAHSAWNAVEYAYSFEVGVGANIEDAMPELVQARQHIRREMHRCTSS